MTGDDDTIVSLNVVYRIVWTDPRPFGTSNRTQNVAFLYGMERLPSFSGSTMESRCTAT